MKIFTTTRTFRNICSTRAAVINLVDDPKLIVSQALKEIPDIETTLEFERSDNIDAPKLSGACAHIEIEIRSVERMRVLDEMGPSEVARVRGVVKNIEVIKPPPYGFRRVDFLLIESAILATRAIEALKRGRRSVAEGLIREIETHREKCAKIAPLSKEAELMMKIVNFLKSMKGPTGSPS